MEWKRFLAVSVAAAAACSERSSTAAPDFPLRPTWLDDVTVEIAQCANLVSGCTWINGGLSAANSYYPEGRVVAYRVVVRNLMADSLYVLTLGYDFTKSGIKLYDFPSTYNATETVNLCASGPALSTLCGEVADSANLPTPVTANFPADPFSGASFPLSVDSAIAHAAFPTRRLTVFGASQASASNSPVHQGSDATDSDVALTVSFRATGTEALLAWGVHIASSAYWDGPNNPKGAWMFPAGSWNGRVVTINGSTLAMPISRLTLGSYGTITVRAYSDENGDGARGSTETFLDSANIHVFGGSLHEHLTTATTGVFSGLAKLLVQPGTYTVCQETPTGMEVTQPTTGASCTGHGDASGFGYSATLAGSDSAVVEFGYQEATTPPVTGSIDVHVFNDKNANGTKDRSDKGLAGWVVRAYQGTTLKGSVTTDANGDGVISGLEPGSYEVCEVIQAPWSQSSPISGSDCSDNGSGLAGVGTVVVITDSQPQTASFGNNQRKRR